MSNASRILAAIVAVLAVFGILAALPADPWQTFTDAPTAPVAAVSDLDACVIIPDGYSLTTTPTVTLDGCDYPEESPDGGYLTGHFLDNSPTYADGWVLVVDDVRGGVTWSDTLDTSAAE